MEALQVENQEYARLLIDIRSIVETQKNRAEKAINLVKVQTYWLIAERIHRETLRNGERASYGKQIIVSLSKDSEFSTTQLRTMILFYKAYPVMQHISANLTWSHYCELIAVENPDARRFYERQALSNRWSIRELRHRIKQDEYGKSLKAQEILPFPPKRIPSINEVIKDTYDFSFLGLSEGFSEQEMEQSLLQHLGHFLLELGYGFAFVGSQYKIFIGEKIHRLDLLFFHIPLCCYIIVDLKVEKFCDRFVGQMNKYLTYFRERECFPYMREPIGLIICREKNTDEVHYALGKLSEEIFVAEYRYCLPKEEELVQHLNKFAVSELTARQQRTLRSIPNDKPFTIHDYKKIAEMSMATARRDIKDLIEKEKIVRKGHGKNTRYQVIIK